MMKIKIPPSYATWKMLSYALFLHAETGAELPEKPTFEAVSEYISRAKKMYEENTFDEAESFEQIYCQVED